MKTFFCILAGVVGGAFGGMGMGGGTLLIPILTLFLGFTQKQAQAINLVAFLPMAGAALFVHTKNGLVDYKGALPLVLPGVIFSALGAFCMRKVADRLLRRCFGGFLLLLAAFNAVRRLRGTDKPASFYAPKSPKGGKKEK